MEDKYKDFR